MVFDVLETIDGFADVGLPNKYRLYRRSQHDYWRHKGTWNTVFNNQKNYKFKLANPESNTYKNKNSLLLPNAYGARYVFDNYSIR